MRNTKSLEGQIAELFTRRLGVKVPSADTDLVDAEILDSLAFVELLTQLEQKFGMHLELDDLDEFVLDNFRSIQKISGFVARWCEENSKLA